MPPHEPPRVGYVVKRYPRYSETFIVNEVLAHEAAGLSLEIFALRASDDSHYQDIISRVRAPVAYLPDRSQKAADFWALLRDRASTLPRIKEHLVECMDVDPRQLVQAVELATLVNERGLTHLHAHFATSATQVARFAAKFSGISYSFTAHAKDIFHDDVDRTQLAGMIHDARTVITVSDFNYAYLIDAFPVAVNKIHRVYNGLDLERFVYSSPGRRAPIIVSCGRLVEKKGFEYLVEACAELDRRSVDFRCRIVGSGEREEALRNRIAEHGLGAQVELLGARPQREVIDLVREAAVFAAPCVVGADGNRDGLPTVLLEAMALGTPCVGTDVTGIPEALIQDVTGICVAQRDTAALADQLQRLLCDEDRRIELAKNARAHIERLFDVSHSASLVRSCFEIPGAEANRWRTA